MQNRIKEEGQLTSFKRGLIFEALNAERPGSKFHKKEMQSILNLIEVGNLVEGNSLYMSILVR